MREHEVYNPHVRLIRQPRYPREYSLDRKLCVTAFQLVLPFSVR